MPRFTCNPALRPRSALGRIPAAITTKSASTVSPLLKATPVAPPFPRMAAVLRSSSTFTPKQSSAEDHCFLPWPGVIKQTARVVEIAKHEHAFFFHSLHRRDQRCASCCNQKFFERRHTAVIAGHGLAFGIDI